jgi:hypothetical protein
MGIQSYVLPYTGEEEKKRILEVIRQHNEFEDPEDADEDYDSPVGEILNLITYGRLLKKRPKYLSEFTHAILCAHGGGRYSTFKWFRDHKVYAIGYDECNKRIFSAWSTWLIVDLDGKVYKKNKKTKDMELVDDYKWKNEEDDNYDLNREDAEEWIQKQRDEFRYGDMTLWKKKKLESIPGWRWKSEEQERKEWLKERTEWLLKKPYDCADTILTQYEDYANGELPPLKIKQLESNKDWKWMTLEECFEVRQKLIAKHAKA